MVEDCAGGEVRQVAPCGLQNAADVLVTRSEESVLGVVVEVLVPHLLDRVDAVVRVQTTEAFPLLPGVVHGA
jgi:hypothetical protein